jgi:hypothetical protein
MCNLFLRGSLLHRSECLIADSFQSFDVLCLPLLAAMSRHCNSFPKAVIQLLTLHPLCCLYRNYSLHLVEIAMDEGVSVFLGFLRFLLNGPHAREPSPVQLRDWSAPLHNGSLRCITAPVVLLNIQLH